MRFLPPDENVDLYATTFTDDLLGRAKVGKSISDIFEKIDDPLVVALDGRWGSGKSFFLKRWVGAHRIQNEGKALTVYFDAFANDYLSEPLVGLVSTLSERVPEDKSSKLRSLKKAAFRLAGPLAKMGLAAASFGLTSQIGAIGDAVVDAAKSEAGAAVDDFWRKEHGRQQAMQQFREAIEALTLSEADEDPTPLVIVVDELDRCRPDYALEIIEVIKHFFSVPHVHFLLGVNLSVLENSVRVRYGPGIDATAYLQKFISFTVSLPSHIGDYERTPAVVEYAGKIGRSMALPQQLLSFMLEELRVLSRSNFISIRDVNKALSSLSLLPDQAKGDRVLDGWRIATVTLIVTKIIRPDLFGKLVSLEISDKELRDYLGVREANTGEQPPIGERNENFEYLATVHYAVWRYIISGGTTGEDDFGRSISRMFDSFRQPQGIRQIPRKINEDWLEIFRVG